MDPRIPDERERFVFELEPRAAARALAVEWMLNGERIVGATSERYAWPLIRGRHTLSATVTMSAQNVSAKNTGPAKNPGDGTVTHTTSPVTFVVK